MRTEAPDDHAVISRRQGLIAADGPAETILMDIDSGNFFALNATASQIWRLVATPTSVGDLCETLGRAFAQDAEQCRRDVIEFVQDLRDRGLFVITAP
jgi:hypothetical protein